MEKLQVIERIRKDCEENGHGRKKWWADNLGIHQQTLSYWLHGHRTPSRKHFEDIDNLVSVLNKEKEFAAWKNYLFYLHYSKQKIPNDLLKDFIIKLLSSETVDSRLLGFLSFIIKNSNIENLSHLNPYLKNRLGWLLEVSGKSPVFKPAKMKTMFFVRTPLNKSNPKTINYLKKIQTPAGKRWKLYDCEINEIRRSFIGQSISTDSQFSQSA